MENKFKEGEAVRALEAPEVALVVRRYVDRVYYCKLVNDPEHKDLVYFERELRQPA
jgi:hypothetical protein